MQPAEAGLSRKGLVRQICSLLAEEYPAERLGNKCNPLDEYLYITLSLRTHERGYQEAYRRFKECFPSWRLAYSATKKEIAAAVAPAGLFNQRAERIKKALQVIKTEFGEISLRKLRTLAPKEAETFLTRLPGVGVKSARCIMMYSLDLDVLPVDTHVWRIVTRLGWIDANERGDVHRELERLIPPKLRFGFHVRCIQHGRAVCRGQHPQCGACVLSPLCPRIGVPSV